MKLFSLFFFVFSTSYLEAQTPSVQTRSASPAVCTIGEFTHTADIGSPKNAGSATYDEATQTYHLKGFPHISPDGKWIAFISFPGDIEPNGHPSYKKVMLRVTPLSQAGAPRVIACLYGGQGTLNVNS